MRIAVIARGIWPQVIGGAERVTKEVVDGLSGHELKVITKYRKEERRPEIGVEIDEEWSKSAALQAVRFNPDVIYICRYWGESAALYIEDIPIVSMHHDIDLDLLPLLPDKYSRLEEMTMLCLERDARSVVASKLTRDYYIENFSAEEERFSVIPLGVDEGEVWEGEIPRGEEFRFLYLGRIAPNKGIHILLQALKDLNKKLPVGLTIYGGFTEDYATYYDYLSDLSRGLPVTFAGRAREEDKRRLYRSFDGVICPSIAHEGFGLAVLEALRYNGVVIASDIFVNTGVVREDVGFVYPRGDSRALASRMMKGLLLSDSERSRLQGKAGRWAERFNWESHVSELEKLLAGASNLLPNQILTKP
ncbi:glycosyltransferase family 4 protein [Dehalococcoidia bacterium]|nr:glycosyltransferase family 4 protein [Dehalococcoidia bacterium]